MKSRRRKLPLRERLRFALLAALTALLASVAAAACGGARQAQTPPGDEPAETAPADEPDDVSTETSGYVRADAEFMRDMLVHHAQALEMTALAPERSASDDLRLLARRIEQTQEFEIGLMRDWLEKRGEPAPEPEKGLGPHGGHGADQAGMMGMAGMASPEQMADLAASEGAAFDRMFLELMIRHHEGALVMVEDLKDHEGAGLEPELFVLLSHIDADQRAEIARMRRFLDSLDSAGDQG